MNEEGLLLENNGGDTLANISEKVASNLKSEA